VEISLAIGRLSVPKIPSASRRSAGAPDGSASVRSDRAGAVSRRLFGCLPGPPEFEHSDHVGPQVHPGSNHAEFER